MGPQSTAFPVVCLLLVSACTRPPARVFEDLGGGQDVSAFALKSIRGTRDGERLDVRALFGDESRTVAVVLQFKINPQARLETGSWSGLNTQGSVDERSTTFLGGQSEPPSIGGRFDLVGEDRLPLYRITIPLQPLTERL